MYTEWIEHIFFLIIFCYGSIQEELKNGFLIPLQYKTGSRQTKLTVKLSLKSDFNPQKNGI